MYKVLVDDNFHYMDESKRYTLGEFPSLEAAMSAARKIVDDFLLSEHKPGMTAAALFRRYTTFGEDPFIVSTGDDPADKGSFSAWVYAQQRAEELCAMID